MTIFLKVYLICVFILLEAIFEQWFKEWLGIKIKYSSSVGYIAYRVLVLFTGGLLVIMVNTLK